MGKCIIIEKVCNGEKIRQRIEQLYNISRQADEEIKTIQKKCPHIRIINGNYSYRPGAFSEAKICVYCNAILGVWDDYSIRVYDFGEKTVERASEISKIIGVDFWFVEHFMFTKDKSGELDYAGFNNLKGLDESKEKINKLTALGVGAKIFEWFGDEEVEVKN